jgi:hypothetical protein
MKFGLPFPVASILDWGLLKSFTDHALMANWYWHTSILFYDHKSLGLSSTLRPLLQLTFPFSDPMCFQFMMERLMI